MDFVFEGHTPITYITDCRDANTVGRLKSRVSTYFPNSNVILVGVKDDVEAAINLVDMFDAFEGRPGIVLMNVARREGGDRKKKWPNGTPFGHVKIGNIDLFTTIDGYVLSMLEELLEIDIEVEIFDIPDTVPNMGLEEKVQERIINTQFRSFDYLPRLAGAIMCGAELTPTETFTDVPTMPKMVCWVDSFGNLKTNLQPEDIQFEEGKEVVIRTGGHKQFRLPCYYRLKDIPDGYVAFTIGSSGVKDKRFIEIMQQGESAANALDLQTGDAIEFVEKVS